ncbi:MAG: sigma-70 family RNA polymerase sigma factor [Planctomycetia bacterium]|nr:sigma-70 family RNA polymerase sigma factor [Planctomycetia bacterium]
MSISPSSAPSPLPGSSMPSSDLDRLVGDLFMANEDLIRYVAMMNAPSLSLVDDIVQEVYVKFAQRACVRDLESDVRPLLRKITHDTAVDMWTDYLRSKPGHLALIYERLASRTRERDSATGLASLEDELTALRLCLKKLTERSLFILKKHYEEGVPLTEIALELEMNINTLYYHADRIRSVLKSCVENTLNSGVPDV